MGYRFLRFPGGKTKAATFSFDDGFWFDVPLSRILNRYGMKATFNITGNYLDKRREKDPDLSNVRGKAFNELPITRYEIEEDLLGYGHEIAVHCNTHRAPGLLRPIDGIREVLDCRMKLEKDFGRIVRGMAYPDSGITRMLGKTDYVKIRDYLTDLDIAYSRTLEGDNDRFELPNDWLAWMPSVYQVSPALFDYAAKFTAINVDTLYPALRYPRLFYVWGHSFEFYTRFGWDRLEQLCEQLSVDPEIWYATNIEICDYVHAYDSLLFSADGTRIFNPTLIDVWFDLDGTVYCIRSGETVLTGE